MFKLFSRSFDWFVIIFAVFYFARLKTICEYLGAKICKHADVNILNENKVENVEEKKAQVVLVG